MLNVYTAGYMTGKGSDRLDWRAALEAAVAELYVEYPEGEVRWLHPGVPRNTVPGKGDPNLYAARDVIQVRQADMVVAYFDLEVSRSLGTAHEVGMAYALGTPVVMIDKSPVGGALDFQRQCALVVVPSIGKAAEVVAFTAPGLALFSERQAHCKTLQGWDCHTCGKHVARSKDGVTGPMGIVFCSQVCLDSYVTGGR